MSTCWSCPLRPASQWIDDCLGNRHPEERSDVGISPKMEKIMEKYLYTIGEVAEILGESTSLVRFWANEFPKFIKPQRNAKGNRLFT